VALLFTGVGALQVAMNRWNIDDWFGSPFITALFITAAICLVFFVVWELFHPDPFINLPFFINRSFILPSLTTGLALGILFSSFALESLWVQETLGYTPGWAGLTLTPVGIFPLLCYPIIGRIVHWLDLRIWVIMSFLLFALTFFWLSRITVYTSYWHIAFPRLVQGIGFAGFTVPNSLLVIRGVPPERLTLVIGLFSFVRTFFVGFGIPLAVTLQIFRETFYQTRVTERTYISNPHFIELLTPFKEFAHSLLQTFALGYDTLVADASTLALADIYYLYMWLFLILAVSVLFYKR
jgi:MFS transporter, DHA2 family, multidrug resistance protein